MFLVLTPNRTEGIPEWPRSYCRLVALARFAIEHPD